jgi:FkbM family methyltransferase
MNIKTKIFSIVCKIIKVYSNLSPLRRGHKRLGRLALRNLGQRVLTAISVDNVSFELKLPQDLTWDSIYFDGTYETGTLKIIKKIVRKDDVVLDIGANLGWYTVHIAKLLPIRLCYSFEPVPEIFERLERHCSINLVNHKVVLNRFAIGEKSGIIKLHTFPDLPNGHSSISTLGRDKFTTSDAPMCTLDGFINNLNIDKIDLIKMDVEGAEMLVLNGSERLLAAPNPPIWIIELNIETSASFGYAPSDLLTVLCKHHEYHFFKVQSGWGEFLKMESIHDYRSGDNAVCVPLSRLDRIR